MIGALVATALAIASASLMLWAVHLLVMRGVKQAAALNTIATVAKTVPIGIFVIVVVFVLIVIGPLAVATAAPSLSPCDAATRCWRAAARR